MRKLILFSLLIVLAGCGEVSVEDSNPTSDGCSDSTCRGTCVDGICHPKCDPSTCDGECGVDGVCHPKCDSSNCDGECGEDGVCHPKCDSSNCDGVCGEDGVCHPKCDPLNCDGVCGEDGVCHPKCDSSNCDGECGEDGLCHPKCDSSTCDGECGEDGLCHPKCDSSTCDGVCSDDGVCHPKCDSSNCDGECGEDGVCHPKCDSSNCDGECGEDGLCHPKCDSSTCDGECGEDGLCHPKCDSSTCNGECGEDGLCHPKCNPENCDGECSADGKCIYICSSKNCSGKCVDNVCHPLGEVECGMLMDGSYRVCNLQDLEDYRKLENKSTINKLIIYGMLMCDETCENIPVDNLDYIVGEDAIITSYVPLSHPLFLGLKDGVTISDLTLNVDLYFKNHSSETDKGTRGILANEATNVTVKDVTVKGVELAASGKLNDAGVLFGYVTGGTFENIKMSDVHISMDNSNGYAKCTNAAYSTNIGGMIGLAEGEVKIDQPIINDMTISARGAARVGGLIGYAYGAVTISGSYNETSESDYDISGIIVQYAERDAGGLIGRFGKELNEDITASATLNKLKLGNISVQSYNQCAGGLIGAGFQGELSIEDSVIETKRVQSSGYAGGMVGKLHSQNSITIQNVENSSQLVQTVEYSDCIKNDYNEENGVIDSRNLGGLIGGVEETSVTLMGIKNEFKGIKGGSVVGGLIGYGVNVDLVIQDVVNRSIDLTDKNPPIEANSTVGGMIGAIYVKKMDISNVVIDNILINTTGAGNAAGLIAYASFDANSNKKTISHVISNTKIVTKAADGNGAGFIFVLNIKGDKSNVMIDNVLVKSEIKALQNGTVAGFIDHIQLPSYDTLCSFNKNGPEYWKCKDVISISNVLVECDLKQDNSRVRGGNILRDVYISNMHLEDKLCANTSNVNYGVKFPSCDSCNSINNDYVLYNNYFIWPGFSKTAMRKIFNNVYYSTPGFLKSEPNQPKFDSWETTLNALNWCGNKDDNTLTGTKENTSDAKHNKGEECAYHRNYKAAVYTCWFTDYIYHDGFVYRNVVDQNISQINGSDIPIKPYHPFFATMNNDNAYSNVDDKINNHDAVLHSLDSTWEPDEVLAEHSWNDCTADVIKSKLTMNYDRLICPVLTGKKYTCMKSDGCVSVP